ncbi:hypothetical protein MMC27_003703 [Xylographa pallens]|nr:hypothetical protein [Xylographa pallens]
MSAMIARDLKLFARLDEDDGSDKTTLKLAKMTGSDPELLSRLLKHMAAMRMIKEVGPDTYRSTRLSKALVDPKMIDAVANSWNNIMLSTIKLPEYLAKTGYKNPENAVDGPFQYGNNTKLHCFAWMSAHPEYLTQFGNLMAGYRQGRPSWMDPDFYPVNDRLVKGANTSADAVFLVDVGGSLGQDIKEFQHKHPNIPGRLVLQDKPEVLEKVTDTNDSIELMGTDFFNPQPVTGARAYYLHSVLHDWPDDDCKKILSNIASAMKPGYSKLLINENTIPDQGAHWEATGLDLVMLTCFSSQERTMQRWENLCVSAGLKVVGIWHYENGVESLIECELA